MYKKYGTNLPDAAAAFNKFKKDTTKEQKRARWKYIYMCVSQELKENNTSPFWKYVNSQRQDSFGVPPLNKDSKLGTDSKTKAGIMWNEFKSVFIHEDKFHIPTLSGPSYPTRPALNISEEGVTKLLKYLDPNKASGPGEIPCSVLKKLAAELSHRTVECGILPKECTEAANGAYYMQTHL